MHAPPGLPAPWVVFGICCLFVVVLPIALVRHWSGTTQRYEYATSGFVFRSPILRRGHVRALPVVFGAAFLVLVTVVLLFFAPGGAPVRNGWLIACLYVMIATVVLAVILYWSVVLFNQPRFLVAPNQRAEPGWVASRRHRRTPAPGERTARYRDAGHTAGERPGHRPQDGQGRLSFDVSAAGGLVEIGDRDAREVPQWQPSTRTALSNGTVVLVAVRPPAEGLVRVVVAPDRGQADGSPEAFAGRLNLPSGVLTVGNTIAGHTEELSVSPARSVRIRVLVDEPGSPGAVTVLFAPDRGEKAAGG